MNWGFAILLCRARKFRDGFSIPPFERKRRFDANTQLPLTTLPRALGPVGPEAAFHRTTDREMMFPRTRLWFEVTPPTPEKLMPVPLWSITFPLMIERCALG